MINTYISSLLVVLLAGAQMVHAQESMDDVFAQLDAANGIEAEPVPMETESASVAAAEVTETQQAPPASEVDILTRLFKKGLEQYKAGQYQDAIMVFDAMLALEPYDSRAITYKRRAAQRVTVKEVQKREITRADAYAEVEAAWNPASKALGIGGLALEDSVDPNQQAIAQMEARLKAIMIPRLDFRDASVEEVVLFLTASSRELDQSGRGINILLVGMETTSAEHRVATAITDISLYDALIVVVEMASLSFEVKPNAVAVMPANYVSASEMVMQSYKITPEVGANLESFGDSGGGVDDLFGDSPSSDSATGPIDAVDFFSIVDFPDGSSAIYQPRYHKLFVKNTPKNLKAIASILADLDESAILRRSQQVEIEAKFVEFNEGALEELGFDWNVYGGGTAATLGLDRRGVITDPANNPSGNGANFVDPITGQQILNDGTGRPGQNVFGGGQRSNLSVFSAVQSGLLATMGGAPAAMAVGNDNIDVQITAMEQEGTADVLSAPKVTTKSGNEAVIRVAETHRYPQDYDVETGQRTAPVVKPQDWEDYDLGVSLKVTPEVDVESNTIDLILEPEIMRFKGYDEYIVGYNSQVSLNGTVADPTLRALMPYFERRSIQTEVTIEDGHTVVMGGLVDERTETFRDQVPFLGDIPYLGRLFRTEGSRTTKKNLTIFVKATQVGTSGMTREERKLARQ